MFAVKGTQNQPPLPVADTDYTEWDTKSHRKDHTLPTSPNAHTQSHTVSWGHQTYTQSHRATGHSVTKGTSWVTSPVLGRGRVRGTFPVPLHNSVSFSPETFLRLVLDLLHTPPRWLMAPLVPDSRPPTLPRPAGHSSANPFSKVA